LNKVANTYWTDPRLAAQRPAARALALATPARELSREIVGTRAEVRRRGGLLPSWVIFSMIILTTLALCLTVSIRTHAEMRAAEEKYERMSSEVEALRNNNASLEHEVERLLRDPRAIEAHARARLNMVRADEIVVPVR
jgi:cell division protein FtsB